MTPKEILELAAIINTLLALVYLVLAIALSHPDMMFTTIVLVAGSLILLVAKLIVYGVK